MKLWIGRRTDGDYEFGTGENWHSYSGFFDNDLIGSITHKGFHKNMESPIDDRLAPGEVRRVKSITIEWEE